MAAKSEEFAKDQDGDSAVHKVPGEFFFATVKAIGTDLEAAVHKPLALALDDVNFARRDIRLSKHLDESIELIKEFFPLPPNNPLGRYQRLMNAGDQLRMATRRGDAVVMEALRDLHSVSRPAAWAESGITIGSDTTPPVSAESPLEDSAVNDSTDGDHVCQPRGFGWVFRNLMHRKEEDRLRSLYGSRLFVIAAFLPEWQREEQLASDLAYGDGQRALKLSSEVAELMRRDAGRLSLAQERDHKYLLRREFVLNVSKTFEFADLFVDARDADASAYQVTRLVELIFGHPFHTPTAAELGMAAAYSAALQSANLARRVGAALVSPDGDLLATGSNDVPRAGGGTYRSDTIPNYQDHKPPWGFDSSDVIRRGVLRNLLESLLADPVVIKELGPFLPKQYKQVAASLATALATKHSAGNDKGKRVYETIDYDKLVNACIRSDLIRNSEVFDVLEYSRSLHAEMDAITTAARLGIPLRGTTLYCTTLPCHECARLIIAAGIRKVVFIEPYEKSRVYELYKTEMHFTEKRGDPMFPDVVELTPYVGISPARFDDLFSWVDRKEDDLRPKRDLQGKVFDWETQRRHGKVRRSIITNDALYAEGRATDLRKHEDTVIRDYQARYEFVLAKKKP